MAIYAIPTDRAHIVTEDQLKKMKPATKEQIEKRKEIAERFSRICRDETRNK